VRAGALQVFLSVGAARAALRDFLGRVATGASQQAAAVLYAATCAVLRPRARDLGQR